MESIWNTLEKLYSNEYFGIGLFVVVTILAFSFLIILFFGKKDEKKRNMQEEEKSIVEENNNLKPDDLDSMAISNAAPSVDAITSVPAEPALEPEAKVDLPNQEPVEEVKEPEFNPFMSSPMLDNNELVNNEENKVEPVATSPMKDDFLASFNFDEPINQIENVNNTIKEEIPVSKEEIVEKPLISEEPIPDIFKDTPKEEKVPENKEIVHPKTTFSNQFSSVYVNKQKDIDSPVIAPSEPSPNINLKNEEIKPVRPEFELPKTLDLPKLNKEPSNTSTGINNNSGINSIISNIENESFEIKKEND